MSILFGIWNTIQSSLFPWLEDELDPLNEKERQFVEVVLLLNLTEHLKEYAWCGIGRQPESRLSLAKALIAKAVYNFETTDILIEYLKGCKNLRRLCGWESRWSVPSKATFSRVFSEFSEKQLPQQNGSKLAGHVSRDTTAIEAREKGENITPKQPRRLDLQPKKSIEENLKDLPTQCDVGTKIDSKGHKTSWIGYKLYLDCIDSDIPVSAVLTSASLHDSQAAIPYR